MADDCSAPPSTEMDAPAIPEMESAPVAAILTGEIYQLFDPVVPLRLKSGIGRSGSYFHVALPEAVIPDVEAVTVKFAVPAPLGKFSVQEAPQVNGAPFKSPLIDTS